jgi:diguanylate cyclase (GGDEF)-like protein
MTTISREPLDPVIATLVELFAGSCAFLLQPEPASIMVGWAHLPDQTLRRFGDGDAPAGVAEVVRRVASAPPGVRTAIEGADGRPPILTAPVLWHESQAVLVLIPDVTTSVVGADTAFDICLGLCQRISRDGHTALVRSRLDDLVTDVATVLTGVAANNLQSVLDSTLETVGRFLGIDTCFLRSNDFVERASILVAEWPRRQNVPDPDPLGIVPFESDDPVFSAIELLAAPLLITPSSEQDAYQERVKGATGGPAVSLAMVPLRPGDVTEGVLGFIHFGERDWADAEVRALRVIAGLLAQVLARVEAEDRLHTLAYRDVLTGLPNRRVFLEEIGSRLASDQVRPFALFFLDLDRLKTTNDIFGHAAGDALITASGARLAAGCREGDLVARLGGDEFVLILDGIATAEGARLAAMSILRDLRVPLMIGSHPIYRSASIGAVTSTAGASVDELLRSADMALLEAKSHGGDEVIVFNEVLDRRTRRRQDLELRLSGAIDDAEFVLFYQPEFDLRTRRITGVEALIRWNHPERGLLSAIEFISVVEETNRSRRLGRWVVEQACTQLAAWTTLVADEPIRMRINVSPGEFLAADFMDDLRAAVDRTHVRPRDLCIEITESSVIRDVPAVVSTLGELRDFGVELAIDDFGTGHSSLVQLKDLPVDILKIDRSFVIGIETDPGAAAIVTAIVGLARSFGLDTVAEGVETEEAARILVDLGCIRAQGYLMSPAVPAARMTQLLRDDRAIVMASLV